MLAHPQKLEDYARIFDSNIILFRQAGKSEEDITGYLKKLHKAFNYNGFRKAMLNRIAVAINVKTCLYCNQQYTIALGKRPDNDGNINLTGSKAFLQFDHFWGEKEYPHLSMSLYNLIPSCPICNQKKSKTHLELKLHPYVGDISSMIRFRIKDKEAFINPKKQNFDLLEVEIDSFGDDDISTFIKKLDLEKRYSRHLDIVKELETALYLSEYYDKHLDSILPIISKNGSCSAERYEALTRHFRGFYPNPDDINKRPLTKFCQDIYEQLAGWYKR